MKIAKKAFACTDLVHWIIACSTRQCDTDGDVLQFGVVMFGGLEGGSLGWIGSIVY